MIIPALPDLNENELAVMKVLWEQGAQSAREIHDALQARRDWSYSTTRTVLERMCKKSFLQKRSFHGLYVYQARFGKPLGLARRVRNFARQVLETDLAPVVSLVARSEALTPEELDELSAILEHAESEE